MRKLFALLLSLSLLLGCFLFAAYGRDEVGDCEPYRVVSTFYGPGAQGFHWYTKKDCPSEVVVDGVTYTGTSEKYEGYYAHSVVAEDLAPGTYAYRVGSDQGRSAQQAYFKVDPGRGTAVDFIVTGDTQASSDDAFAYSAATLNAAWGAFPGSDFYVTLGDFTNNCDNAEWDMNFFAFKDINGKNTLVPIAGNHDGNLKWNWFRRMFTLKEQCNPSNLTGVYYSFDYGDAHFAVLNSNDLYPMSAAQQNWLVNDMRQTDAKWKIVFMHRAPYSAGNDCIKLDNMLVRRAVMPLFDQLGVDLVMHGHDHHYYRSVPVKADKPDPDGTVYIMPGAACTKRYALHENILPSVVTNAAKLEQNNKPIFSHLEIDGGTLTYKAFEYDPETTGYTPYDEVTLTKSSFDTPDPNRKLRTDVVTTLPQQIWNLVKNLTQVVFIDYIGTLLPQMITGNYPLSV